MKTTMSGPAAFASTLALVTLMLLNSALAQITITSPTNGNSVPSPVWLRAHTTCNGSPTAFGYSIDNSVFLTGGVTSSDIDNTDYRLTPGTHTVHFKAWSNSVLCTMDSTITVTTTGATPSIAGANLDQAVNDDNVGGPIPGWLWEHDAGTNGQTAQAASYKVASPSFDGTSRLFYFTFSASGGERYHLCFKGITSAYNRCSGTPNPSSHHFVYDTYLYIVHPENLQNVELDMNQATDASLVYIFGTQCSFISKTWEFTTNVGGQTHWTPSGIACNPRTWMPNVWHHAQIVYHRDDAGNVTYDSVTFDGTTNYFPTIAANVQSAFPLGWSAGDLLLNMQFDGNGTGSIQAYADGLTILSW